MSDWRIGLDEHALAAAVVDQVERRVADMGEDLIDHRLDRAIVEKVVQVRPLEIGDADRAQLARAIGLFKGTPRLKIAFMEMLTRAKLGPGLRAVDEHKVYVIQPERAQRAVDALRRLGVGLALGGELGGHEYLVTRDAAGAQTFAYTVLVGIGLSRVEMAIADFGGISDHLRHGGVLDPPGAQPQFGDGHAIGQGERLFQYHDPCLCSEGRAP